jgi:dynein regulatory complex protein 1
MQVLEKCMEDMKAVYKLNEEKLEFNHKVLSERKKVNETTRNALKKKERRQKENLRTVKTRFDDQSDKFKNTNIQLTEDYKRITR